MDLQTQAPEDSPSAEQSERSLLPLPDFGDAVRCRYLTDDELQSRGADRSLVVVVEPNGDTSAEFVTRFLREHSRTLLSVCAEHGAVLLRGFELELATFERATERAFDAERYVWMFPLSPGLSKLLLRLPVLGFLVRALLRRIEAKSTGRTLHADKISELASDDTIQFPHHEYGIFFNVPKLIAFYCERAPERHGETFLCDAEAAYERLAPHVRAEFERARHIRYKNQNQRYLPAFSAPAVLCHPDTKRKTINLTAYHHDAMADIARTCFPNTPVHAEVHDETFSFEPTFVAKSGERYELSPASITEVIAAHLERCVLLTWRTNDLLLVDNFKVMHGRVNAGTPKKKLHVILCEYVRNQNGFLWK